MKLLRALLIAVIVTSLTACFGGEEEVSPADEAEEEKEVEIEYEEIEEEEENHEDTLSESQEDVVNLDDINPIPETIEELASQMPGPFAGESNPYEVTEELEEKMSLLGPMSDNPTDEEYELYLRYVYWLFADDYINPQDVIRKWEFASSGSPELPDDRFQFKENYNVEILLDASGSMGAYVGNRTQMDIAKEAIQSFMAEVPEAANVSLRVYGHEGSSSASDKELSCAGIEQVYGFAPYDETEFQEALNQFEPRGWTPLADALEQSREALSEYDASNHTNLIYVVSDGIETCDGDPVKVAQSLAESNAQPIINIIGFHTDAEAQRQLEEMAEVTDGIFATARDEDELKREFERAEEVLKAWEDWKEDNLREIELQEIYNQSDINNTRVNWRTRNTTTSVTLHQVFDILWMEFNYLTLDQKNELINKKDQMFDVFEGLVEELDEQMEEVSEQTIEDAKKSIEEQFNRRVNE
ncbi:VWA domain-containing protein [Alkalibacillus haloalkaliphilus]|uniref:VWA domain-containing protein n=1 Tax=Alkalibacillus haloalkaliphilus TaxID=94136 RepID=UPI002935E179|nr:VWA domain-containing protein [Alkalibacillus haloalkaliphilus]MDV2581456.1 VWA domain-containing protein [Alkalibacillus haloalkaliphilus]